MDTFVLCSSYTYVCDVGLEFILLSALSRTNDVLRRGGEFEEIFTVIYRMNQVRGKRGGDGPKTGNVREDERYEEEGKTLPLSNLQRL